MGTSVIGGNSLRMKSDFTFVILVSLNSDINFKLKNGSDRFINWSNLYHQRIIHTLDVKEFTVGIIKSGVKMEQSSGIAINARGQLKVLLSV